MNFKFSHHFIIHKVNGFGIMETDMKVSLKMVNRMVKVKERCDLIYE